MPKTPGHQPAKSTVEFLIMAKADPAAEALAKLAALRRVDDLGELATGLEPLLKNKSHYVVARAAELAGERRVRTLLPLVVETLDRFLRSTSIKDPGCAARFALAKTAVDLEAGYEAQDVMMLGVRYAAWESDWGGSIDVAVAVRGQCAIGLAAMKSRFALRCATELLAEPDTKPPRERVSWPARRDAAHALRIIGSDGSAAVLRFKVLLGDPEPTVLGECLSGVIAIDEGDGIELAASFLPGELTESQHGNHSSAEAEAALLAIGGSRHPASVKLLLQHERRFLNSPSLATYFIALAMTRQDAAIDYLLAQVGEGNKDVSKAAAEALDPLRLLPRVGERLLAAIARQKA